MKIIFFGTPSFVVPVLESLNNIYDVLAVVTAPDRPVGRNHVLTPSPVKKFALEHNIPVLTPEKLSDSISQVSSLKSQLFVVAAYGKLIPAAVLDLPTFGAINIHPSNLPQYRGPSPITQTILNGDKTSAISFMQMDEKMDHGPILKTVPYDIPDDATTETLTRDMFQKSADLLPEIIDDYVAGKLTPAEQNHNEATYTHIIKKEDGYIDLDNPPSPEDLARKIRAYYPWPTVWTRLPTHPGGGRVQRSGSHDSPGVNGETKLIKLLPENKIQMEGKNPVSTKDFLNGYPEMREMRETIEKVLNA